MPHILRLALSLAALICMHLASAVPALAGYTAKAGDRARPLAGWDVVNQQTARLEDYLGSWVLIEFWASWCGPCMNELPNLIAQTRELRKAGKLELLSINCDSHDTVQGMYKAIRRYGIDFPVLFDGGDLDCVPAEEWGVDAIPATFLVNPQGVIAATGIRGPALGRVLSFYLEGNPPLVSLECTPVTTANGAKRVVVCVGCSTREPVAVSVGRFWEDWRWDDGNPDGKPSDIDRHLDADYFESVVAFGEFSEAMIEVDLQARPEMDTLGFLVAVKVPGTDHFDQAGKAGLWQELLAFQCWLPGIEFADGKWKVKNPDE